MGKTVSSDYQQNSYIMSGKKPVREDYNIKIAIWQLPEDKRFRQFDTDNSKWFEASNYRRIKKEDGEEIIIHENEIENLEKSLNINLDKYKAITKTTTYNDRTKKVQSYYRNYVVNESHGKNSLYVNIKNAINQIVAEKICGKDSNQGKKLIYQHIKNGDDTFTIVKVYTYDTTKNLATDVVNFAYTSLSSSLTKGCTFEKEYYLLNGKEVNATRNKNGEFSVKNKNGKKLTFQVE